LTRKDKLLLILAHEHEKPKTSAEIRQIAVVTGLRVAQKWNIASILSSTNGLAVRVPEGWILTSSGIEYLQARNLYSVARSTVLNSAIDLREHVDTIKEPNTKRFLEEAIGCLEANFLRSAVVLSWTGAVALLYNHVVQNYLSVFNLEAKRRDPKWRDAVTTDDLARMKEHDFLEILEAISVIGRSVKQELQNNCLKLRNACGHPNSFNIGSNRVAAHIEILIQNVFSKY
jgi:hypothetical protein